MADRETKIIKLKKPFEGAGGMVTEIILQEPAGSDYFILGDPQTWVRASGGMALVDNTDAIKAYTERMIIKPDPLLAMARLSVIDARAVKNSVLSFFEDATPTP
jgi:hypothetical protein